jgi:energy-coupling factor transporter ATP-binding protein EcfA2
LREVDLELREGEIVVLTGANGSGKTSLARVAAGLDRPDAGLVDARGSRVAMMLPVAELQLTAASVLGELEGPGLTPGELARVLRRHELEDLAARAPWSLSRGERQRLVHAALDTMRPDVMIVDEPGQGLDGENLRRLVDLIHRRAARGRAYLLITHREELAAAAHRRLEIRDRMVHEVSP